MVAQFRITEKAILPKTPEQVKMTISLARCFVYSLFRPSDAPDSRMVGGSNEDSSAIAGMPSFVGLMKQTLHAKDGSRTIG